MTSIEQMQVSKAVSCFRPNKSTLAATVRAKRIDPVKNVSVTAWRSFFVSKHWPLFVGCFVCNKQIYAQYF